MRPSDLQRRTPGKLVPQADDTTPTVIITCAQDTHYRQMGYLLSVSGCGRLLCKLRIYLSDGGDLRRGIAEKVKRKEGKGEVKVKFDLSTT